jgi:hypothetical protein
MTVPLGGSASLATFAGLPWESLLTVRSGEQTMPVIAGPVMCQRGEWVLPVLYRVSVDPHSPLAEVEAEVKVVRQRWGVDGRTAGPAGTA